MEEWKEYRLGDFMEFNPKISLKKETVARKITMDQLVPHSRDIFSWTYEPYSGGAKFQNGDTIMARITPCLENGKHAFISVLDENEIAYGSTEYIVMRGRKGISDNLFVYYLTHFPSFKDAAIKSMVGTSGRQRAQVDVLENMTMKLPSIVEQKNIADILTKLDDKIAVNKQINDNLEQQAQTLFKSWFVDFDPFRDQPFVESELGMIPKGWRVVSLDEACTKITDGSHFSPKDNTCGTIPMLSVKDMHHNGFDYSSCKMIDEVEYLKMKKNDCIPLFNDILVAKDGSYLKEIFICKEEKKQAILSSIAIFRSNPKVIYPDLLLQLLRLPKIKKDVGDNYVSGSALPRIVLKDFKKFKFVVPPVDIQETTIDVYISINAQIEKNETESRRLAQLRDTLLPRLMSGELRVNEIENAI